MKNIMKKISVLLSVIAILAWGGVTVGCSDGYEDGDYDPKALEGLWIDSENDANAVYFKDGKAYFDLQKGDDGAYSSAEDGAPYTVKGDVITAGDATAKILEMRVEDYVKLSAGGETATYKYSDKGLSSGGSSGGEDGEYDYSKYYAKEFDIDMQTLVKDGKVDGSKSIQINSDKVAKIVSFECKTDSDSDDISIYALVKPNGKYVKAPDIGTNDGHKKVTKEFTKFTTSEFGAKDSDISNGKAGENGGWYLDGGSVSNDALMELGVILYSGSELNGKVTIRKLLVIDQDNKPIDLSSFDWY